MSSLKRFTLLAALAAAPVAHAQVPVATAEIAIDPPTNVIGDTLAGLKLRKTVLLMRHGVRPPTSTSKFQVYANAPLPTWDVPDGNLTGPGAALVTTAGTFDRLLYSAEGTLAPTGCPRTSDLFVWSDNADERTVATGNALVSGLYPGCNLQTGASSSTVADPLFSPNFPQNTTSLIAAVLKHMGGSFTPLQTQLTPLLAQMSTVLGCCSTSICQSMVGTIPCSFGQIPWSLTASGNSVSFNGALGTGSSISEIYELEYANGFTGNNVAFGRTDEAGVQQLMKLYTTKYREFDRTPALARANGSNIARQILDAVESGAGISVQGGPPNARLTVFVGHDSTLSAVGGLMGLDWHSPTFNTDDMPPGGAMGFELLSTPANQYYVRPVFITQTLDEMHAGGPLTLSNLPAYQGLSLSGCEYENGRVCSLQNFISIMSADIDPASTAPMLYK